MSLAPNVADELATLGTDSKGKPNLSAGIAIAHDFMQCAALAGVKPIRHNPPPPSKPRGWLVFELVDGPADPPPPGVNFDLREGIAKQHVWTPADELIRWEHCSVCLIIKRTDGKNENERCKGNAPLALRKAYSTTQGGPEFDAP